MNHKAQMLRAMAMLALMGGALYTVSGCGGAVSSTSSATATDTNDVAGQHLYVANQSSSGSASALRYDEVLDQTNGATISPDAQFTGFNTLGQISVDFSGNLLAPDEGENLVSVFDSAETDSGVVSSSASLAINAAAPAAATFDSSNSVFYVVTNNTIEQFPDSSGGTSSGTLTDSLLTGPKLLAFDDVHTPQVLFVAGTTASGGMVAIYTTPQSLVGQGDVSTNADVAHISSISGITMVNPTGIAYDETHEQLWIADPGAGYVFIIDNANNITASAVTSNSVLGAALQIQATQLAVDFSSGVAALMTINASGSSPNTVSIYTTTDQIGADEGLFTSSDLPTPDTLVLNGVTTPVSLVDDSTH